MIGVSKGHSQGIPQIFSIQHQYGNTGIIHVKGYVAREYASSVLEN